MRLKLAESTLKRENALKEQRETIQSKIEQNEIKTQEIKKQKAIKIEESKEKGR